MPVFDTAAAARASRLPHYLDIQQKRALTAGTKAQTDLMNKQVELYDTEVGIKKQNADTAASNSLRQWQEFWAKGAEEEKEAVGNAFAAYDAAYKETNDDEAATGAFIDSLSVNYPEAVERFAGQTIRPEMAEAAIMTADEQLIRGRDGKSYQQADFISPDGRAVQGSFDPETGEYIESDMSPIAPQATQGDISDPRTPSQQGAAYDKNLSQYNESSNVQEMIGAVLPRVSDLPGAVGFTGKAAIAGAGVLTTMGYDEAATAFSQWLASANPEEVAGVMAQLQAVRGQLIPIVTGQESRARLSDQEQQLGDKAVALINQIQGPSDLAKAYPQVVGALRQFYEESWAKQYRIAKQDEYIDWPYDLTDRDEMVDFVQEALNAGLDEDSIRRMVTRMKLIQGVGSE
jgi:hypothetical protein